MQDAKRTSGVDALTRGSLYLQKLGKEGQRLAANINKHAVDQKKAKGNNIRGMVEFADLEGLKKLPPSVKGCTLQLLQSRHQYTAFYTGVCPGSRSRTWVQVQSTAGMQSSFDLGMVPACFGYIPALPSQLR